LRDEEGAEEERNTIEGVEEVEEVEATLESNLVGQSPSANHFT
jgi:hypothetical protein